MRATWPALRHFLRVISIVVSITLLRRCRDTALVVMDDRFSTLVKNTRTLIHRSNLHRLLPPPSAVVLLVETRFWSCISIFNPSPKLEGGSIVQDLIKIA